MNSKNKEFSDKLIEWYSKNGRTFPWRYTFDPFKVFISEIMLQRTRAENITEPFNNFLKNIKSVNDLKNADESYLYQIFSTLGLIYRVKKLITISEHFCKSYSCNVPDNQNDLLNTPGIGLYTCNAILCFGYGMKYPIVDSNVLRIFGRFFGVKSSTKSPP